jgi:dephospho-CoA kinase
MTHPLPVIGIVGGIGSGKSAVAGILRELGCVVADSDGFARKALLDPAIKREIVSWWGEGVLDRKTGEIDRRAIASIVFSDPAQRQRLESLTHPWIERRRRELFAAAAPTAKALVIDAPLLLEAGLKRECDAIIFVDTPDEARSQRVAATRGWTAAQWHAREAAQMPLDRKRLMADHVVVNNGNLDDLRAAVQRVFARIVKPAEPPAPASRK